MKRKQITLLLLLLSLTALSWSAVAAQAASPYTLSLRKLWGYGGFGNDIQGRFQIRLNGPLEAVQKGSYYLDGQLMGEQTAEPFSLNFETGDYALGSHQLDAELLMKDGSTAKTPALTLQFLSAENSMDIVVKILVPVLGLSFLGMLLGGVLTKEKPLKPGEKPKFNGLYGGAVCPKCGHPFARSAFGLNLGAMRLERCPACKRWVNSRRASPGELEAAYLAEENKYKNEAAALGGPGSADVELEKQIEDSRYFED